MRLVAESPTDWDVASWRALAECDSLERRRVPRTFWGSNEPRADAVAPWRAMRPYLIQMGVWCASANDVQPRERKTGCAWTDDRESSDASTRQRFRAPLDKGPVNGRPQSGGQSGGRRSRAARRRNPVSQRANAGLLRTYSIFPLFGPKRVAGLPCRQAAAATATSTPPIT
jgi:hypothetical protein